MRKFIAAKAIIWNDQDQVLLVHRVGSNLHSIWEVPGGRLETEEMLHDALRREVKEETGIDEITIVESIGAGEWTPIKGEEQWHIVGVFFTCTVPTNARVRLSEEHDEYVWANPKNLSEYNIAPDMLACIRASAERRGATHE